MKHDQITPSDVQNDPTNPNWTTPRSYGVWKLSPADTGKQYRYGNYPVRERELINEFGSADFIALYLNKSSAIEHVNSLNQLKADTIQAVVNK